MYTIYSDGNLLYAPYLSHEGYGVLSPKLTVELNKAGSLEYTLPPNNIMYNSVQKLKSIITVFNDEEEIFRGRVLNDEKDFYKQKKTYCEGELAFLLDSKQRPYSFTGTVGDLFRQYISNHNSRVEANKQFAIGNITIDTANDEITCVNESYATTIDEITKNLLDYEGGYIKTRGVGSTRYIDYLKSSGNSINQTIEFGVNLLDISEYISAENIVTVVIPIGKTLYDKNGNVTGKTNISSINNGNDYIENATAISLFGRIESVQEWSDIEDPALLKTLGESFLSANIEMSVSLDITAVDLHHLNVDVDRIHVGDWVNIISIPHGLNKAFQCTKIIYDLVSPENTEYIFGSKYTSLTEQQTNTSKTANGTYIVAQSGAAAANNAAVKAEQAIAAIPGEIAKAFENAYPIGSVFMSTDSVNPVVLFGFGTWELIDKEFKTQTVTPTYTEGAVKTFSSFLAFLSGHSIQFRIDADATSKAITDDNVLLFTINAGSCGLTQFNDNSYRSMAYSDGGNALIGYYIGTEGGFYANDVTVRGSGSASLAKDTDLSAFTTAPITISNINYMLDEFCDKFYWKRIA